MSTSCLIIPMPDALDGQAFKAYKHLARQAFAEKYGSRKMLPAKIIIGAEMIENLDSFDSLNVIRRFVDEEIGECEVLNRGILSPMHHDVVSALYERLLSVWSECLFEDIQAEYHRIYDDGGWPQVDEDSGECCIQLTGFKNPIHGQQQVDVFYESLFRRLIDARLQRWLYAGHCHDVEHELMTVRYFTKSSGSIQTDASLSII